MPSYEEKPPLLAKRKVTHHGEHRTSQSGKFQRGVLTSGVSQEKDGGLAGLPPLQEHPKKSSLPKQEGLSHRHPCWDNLALVHNRDADHSTKRLDEFHDRSSNRRVAIRERTDGIMLTPKEKLGYIRMAAVRHNRSTAINSGTSTQYSGRIYTRSTEEKGTGPGACESHQVEVQKLLEARIMREVYYHEWLSNPVMVKKHDGSWRMCMDFTDLNKACPQDCYPLPEIDWKVESLWGYPFKCFLDAYKGYHQIQMAESDEEKTTFHTSHGAYCYTKMPFGLNNAGATYQRLVDKAFDSQVGRNIEVYVMNLYKSHTEQKC
uniref:Reverse transcriptase domain-containing protein n=1 Tax=Tanacetum coccineum TaxID=301880 RepID=A0ABQ5GFU6_9ASTR